MINPQTIDPLGLPSVSLHERSQLPTTPCIYFAIDSQDVVQYIGQSKNPRKLPIKSARIKMAFGKIFL